MFRTRVKLSHFIKNKTIKIAIKHFVKAYLKYVDDVWLTLLSSQRVKDNECFNTTKTIGNGMPKVKRAKEN